MTVIDNVAAYKQTAENHLIHLYARLRAKVHVAENVAQEVADKTGKARVYGVLWLFFYLLISAVVANYSTTFVSQQRDLYLPNQPHLTGDTQYAQYFYIYSALLFP